jgi:hypothetical protein
MIVKLAEVDGDNAAQKQPQSGRFLPFRPVNQNLSRLSNTLLLRHKFDLTQKSAS